RCASFSLFRRGILRGFARLKTIDAKILAIEANNKELKNRNTLIEQITKVKIKIEAQLEILIENTPPKDLKDSISELKRQIKKKELKLSSYKIEEKMEEVEKFINSTMSSIGKILTLKKTTNQLI
ncbi:hypothetical protein, partial [Enterovibrio norvegicus]|uniref:hypothetical protein n=1 Tax=Enterovibrio norvegicus TaxID=188144 RepID=UPI00352CC5A2